MEIKELQRMHGGQTTLINIDYYEELKRKADMYDNAKVIIDFTNAICYSHEEKTKNFVLPIVRYDDFKKLKEKADAWDEKETPCNAEILTKDERGKKSYVCKCSGVVEDGERYCWNCGRKLKFD